MFENNIVVYRFIQDLHFFVIGGDVENELALATVLQGFYDVVTLLFSCYIMLHDGDKNVALGPIMFCLRSGRKRREAAYRSRNEYGIQNLDNENRDVVIVPQEVGKHDFETNKGEVLNFQPPHADSKPESPNTKPNSSVIGSQVVEVGQVNYDSIYINTVSITEKNELKDDVIADDVKIEVDLKPAQPSFSKVTLDDGNTESVVAVAPLEDKVTTKEKHVTIAQNCRHNEMAFEKIASLNP
ncbi:apoptotic chromatin condensation inducer in the nucleus-like protein isoform X1 [Tanacetum coccineum]